MYKKPTIKKQGLYSIYRTNIYKTLVGNRFSRTRVPELVKERLLHGRSMTSVDTEELKGEGIPSYL
jgi:hypothetical protein